MNSEFILTREWYERFLSGGIDFTAGCQTMSDLWYVWGGNVDEHRHEWKSCTFNDGTKGCYCACGKEKVLDLRILYQLSGGFMGCPVPGRASIDVDSGPGENEI